MDGISVRSIRRIPSPSTSYALAERPRPGSGADKLFQRRLRMRLRLSGDFRSTAAARSRWTAECGIITNIEQQVLDPEKAVNWAIGFDYTPTGNFLTGLNIQATYYIVKINGILRGFGNPTNGAVQRFRHRLRLCDPGRLARSGHRTRNSVRGRMRRRGSVRRSRTWCGECSPIRQTKSRRSLQTLVYWINDGGTMNNGWQTTKGIDFQVEL